MLFVVIELKKKILDSYCLICKIIYYLCKEILVCNKKFDFEKNL